jgi:multicomponent Na+:H+ antiporter subunit G
VILDVVAAALMVTGVGFIGVTALALVRFPDFWTRAHAVAKAETMGLVLVLAGLIVHHRFGPGSMTMLLVAVFALLVNPTALHSLARSGARPARANGATSEAATPPKPPARPPNQADAGQEVAS